MATASPIAQRHATGAVLMPIPDRRSASGPYTSRTRRSASAVHSLRRGAAEAIELTAHGDARSSKVVGRRLDELNLPSSVTVGAILRGDEVLASGDITIACVDQRTLKPKRIPAAMMTCLRG